MIRVYGFAFGQVAICLWPFIFFTWNKKKGETYFDKSLKVHEAIHWHQQADVLIVSLPAIVLATIFWSPWALLAIPVGGPWWVMYLGEYLWRRIRWGSHYRAYLTISAEREARLNEGDPTYLARRKFLAQFRVRHIENSYFAT